MTTTTPSLAARHWWCDDGERLTNGPSKSCDGGEHCGWVYVTPAPTPLSCDDCEGTGVWPYVGETCPSCDGTGRERRLVALVEGNTKAALAALDKGDTE